MPDAFAIGVFRTLGAAEDARARLVHEGVPEADIEVRRLARDAVIPARDTPKTMVSFLDWLFGTDLTERYGVHVTNGETVLGVCGRSEAEIERALAVMRLFAPLHLAREAAPLSEPAATAR